MGEIFKYKGQKVFAWMNKIKKRVFDIIQVGRKTDVASNLFDFFIVLIIFINLFCVIFETFEESLPYRSELSLVEAVTTGIFLVEYILRVWTADYLYPNKKPVSARITFLISFFGVIDLLSFLPYYLPLFFPTGLVAFRMFRVIRIFRLFRINAKYDAFNIIADVVSERKDQLFSSMMLILMLMIASSMLMYSLEHQAQPELFENAFSGIWWAVSALLTVGYGDIYPVTVAGRVMAIVISFLGVGLVSIPTGIISAGFVEKYSKMTKIEDFASAEVAELNNDIIITKVNPDHVWVGQNVNSIIMPPGLRIGVIKRGDKMSPPMPDTIIQAGDYLMIQTEF